MHINRFFAILCALLSMALYAMPAVADMLFQEKPAMGVVDVLDVSVKDDGLEILLYTSGESRADNLSVSLSGEKLLLEKVVPASSGDEGCSYVILMDMPKLTSTNLKRDIEQSYRDTLTAIMGYMADGDNVALVDTQEAVNSKFQLVNRATFAQKISNLSYQIMPQTLTDAIGGALAFMQSDETALRRRTCLIVLTNGFGKEEGNTSYNKLVSQITNQNTSVYVIAYPTTAGRENEVEQWGELAKASVGGCFYACDISNSSSERQLILDAFKENEQHFYWVKVSLEGLDQESALEELKVEQRVDSMAYSLCYALDAQQQDVLRAILPPKATPVPTSTPAPTPEPVTETEEPAPLEQEANGWEQNRPLILLCVGGVAVVLLLVVVGVARGRKKQKTLSADKESMKAVPHMQAANLHITLMQVGTNENARYEADMDKTLVIGRNPAQARLVIPGDGKISGKHAVLMWDGNALRIEDCGSTNGTAVNSRRILSATVLHQGDQLQFGRTCLRISWEKTSASK